MTNSDELCTPGSDEPTATGDRWWVWAARVALIATLAGGGTYLLAEYGSR